MEGVVMMVLLYFLNYFNSLNSGSNIDHTVIGISRKHARDRRKPPTYCDDGTVTLIEKHSGEISRYIDDVCPGNKPECQGAWE